MNEQELKELTRLVRAFETTLDEKTYKALAQFIEQKCPCFREMYHLVSSADYTDWSASE